MLQLQTDALQRVVAIQDQALTVAGKIVDLQDKALATYQQLTFASEVRATSAEARAERAESVAKWTGPLGLLLGIGMSAALAAFAR